MQSAEDELLGERRHDGGEQREDDELERPAGRRRPARARRPRRRSRTASAATTIAATIPATMRTATPRPAPIATSLATRDAGNGRSARRHPGWRARSHIDQRGDQHDVDDDSLRELAEPARPAVGGVAQQREQRRGRERSEQEPEQDHADERQEPPRDLRAPVGQRVDRWAGRDDHRSASRRRADRGAAGSRASSDRFLRQPDRRLLDAAHLDAERTQLLDEPLVAAIEVLRARRSRSRRRRASAAIAIAAPALMSSARTGAADSRATPRITAWCPSVRMSAPMRRSSST